MSRARHLSACLFYVSASGAIIAAATANSRVCPNKIPTIFIGRAWPNFPSFYSTFQKNPNKNHPQVWALCRDSTEKNVPLRCSISFIWRSDLPRGAVTKNSNFTVPQRGQHVRVSTRTVTNKTFRNRVVPWVGFKDIYIQIYLLLLL